jgi:excisionase family DNA binding protein
VSGRLLTARVLADMLDVSAETVLRCTRRGEFAGVVVYLPGGAIRFRKDALDSWLAERATPAGGFADHPAGRRPHASVHSLTPITPTSEED